MGNLSVREKMNGMNPKEKMQYIWEYYKIHMIAVVLLIAFAGSYIYYATGDKIADLSVTIIGHYINQDKLENLQSRATNELVKDPKHKKEIKFDFLQQSDNPADPEYSMNVQMKLSSSVAAKEIDILILDRKHFEFYANQGAFLKLTSISGLSQLNIPDSDFMKYQPMESNGKTDGKEGIYGINVSNLPVLKDLQSDGKDNILCVIAKTKRLDKVEGFLKWLFSQK